MDTSSKSNPVADIVKGLIALLFVVLIIACGLIMVGKCVSAGLVASFSAFSSLDAAIVVALITGSVSIITVVAGSIINNVMKYKQQKSEYLRLHREVPYKQLISIFYDMQAKTKLGEEYTEVDLLNDMTEFNKELTLWGSSKAIRLWGEWRISSAKVKPDPKAILFEMEKVLIQLRRDIGQKRGVKQGDILKLFINDIDDKYAIMTNLGRTTMPAGAGSPIPSIRAFRTT